jgi:phosphoglycerate dehydrogenase-like enzyme
MRIAVLDDYQGLALKLADWSKAPGVAVVPFRDHVADENELVARLQDFDGVLRIRERTAFPRSVLERLPRLKLLLATGMRNSRSIDLATADARGITVCATEASHQTTVEVTWALILGLCRALPREIASVLAGGWQVGLGRSLIGATLGIVGFGNMGRPVAKIAQGFGMKVVAWSPHLTPQRTAPHDVECVGKDDLLRRSDVVTVHMPLAEATVGLIGARELALMKRDAFIVNTARAQVVDERALIDALTERRIGGAGLDVFEVEPLPLGHPFRTLPNVIATPHIGFVTEDNYRTFFQESLENLLAYLDGKPIRTITADRPFLPDSQVARSMFAAGNV